MSKLTVKDLHDVKDLSVKEIKGIFGGSGGVSYDTIYNYEIGSADPKSSSGDPVRPKRPGNRQKRVITMEPLVVFPTDEYD